MAALLLPTHHLLVRDFAATRVAVRGHRKQRYAVQNKQDNVELRLAQRTTSTHVRQKIWPNTGPCDSSHIHHDLHKGRVYEQGLTGDIYPRVSPG